MGDPTAVGDGIAREVRNDRALAVYERVQKKLTGSYPANLPMLWTYHLRVGRDFDPDVPLSVKSQVDKLITEATSLENLSLLFSGW